MQKFGSVTREEFENKVAHCDQHGDYITYRVKMGIKETSKVFWTPCEKCLAEISKREEDERFERIKIEQREAKIQRLLSNLGIPTDSQGKHLVDAQEGFSGKQDKALKLASRFIETFEERTREGTNIILIGAVGVGKTHIASVMLTEIVERYAVECKMVNPTDLALEIRGTYDKKGESEIDIIERYSNYDLLVMDDVGMGSGGNSEVSCCINVLSKRYYLCLPTIITSNMNTDSLKKYLGDRVFDRFRQNSVVTIMKGESMRKPKPIDWI